jgi:hypothetical protein
MNEKRRRTILKLNTSATGVVVLLSFCCLIAPAARGQSQTNKAEISKQASRSYYGVRKYGLMEFQARVTPTWEVAVKGIESNPEALKLLRGLRFTMSFGADDKVKLNHEATMPAPNATVETGFKQLFDGVEQMVSGFFATWDLFMLTSPFPQPDAEYELKDLGSTYLLTYKEADADIAFTMTKDFSITEFKVVTPEFSSLILPKFTKTAGGYVLIGYSATYEPAKGPGKVALDLQIDYEDVSGLKLPHRIRVHSVLDGEPTESELIFSEYQVKTR